jgi:hypothetical protein
VALIGPSQPAAEDRRPGTQPKGALRLPWPLTPPWRG